MWGGRGGRGGRGACACGGGGGGGGGGVILGEVKARPKDIISFSLDYISKSKVQTSNPSSSPISLDTPARPADFLPLCIFRISINQTCNRVPFRSKYIANVTKRYTVLQGLYQNIGSVPSPFFPGVPTWKTSCRQFPTTLITPEKPATVAFQKTAIYTIFSREGCGCFVPYVGKMVVPWFFSLTVVRLW